MSMPNGLRMLRMSSFSSPARSESSNAHPTAPAMGGRRNGISGRESVAMPMRASVRSFSQASTEPTTRAMMALPATTTTVLNSSSNRSSWVKASRKADRSRRPSTMKSRRRTRESG